MKAVTRKGDSVLIFPEAKPRAGTRLLLALGLAVLSGWLQAALPRRTVVILHSVSPEETGQRELTEAILNRLKQGSPVPLDVYNEYTGLDHFQGATYESSLLALYNEKYGSRKVDLLIPVGPTALDFVVGRKFLSQVPVVTCYVAERFVRSAQELRPELTGAIPSRNAPKTIDLMLSMYPGTRRIEVVLGASAYERDQAKMGRIIFSSFNDRITFEYLNDLSIEQMEAKVGALPNDTLVLYGSLLQDATGRDFETAVGQERVSRASRRPVFGVVEEDLGAGILGGILLSQRLSGEAAAELGLRVLAGQKASSLPLGRDSGAAPIFDSRELARWHIHDRDLPPGSLIKFRKPTLWDAYWKEISGALAIILVEAMLVAGLVIQLRRRKAVEAELVEAQMRYRNVADFTHDWEFWQSPGGQFTYVSPACARISGFPPSAFLDDARLMERIIHEEDLPAWTKNQAEALAGHDQTSLVYRIVTQAGEVRWMEQTNNPVWLSSDRLAGNRGSIRDITARRQGELDLLKAYREIGTLKDQLEAENTYYRVKIQTVEGSSEILGMSDPIKYLLFRINQVAQADTTVLIQGETGTGKELVAEAIHKLSHRKDQPLVRINCAALPPGLAESELFGHEKGAFTGAQSLRKGRFELADGATLFLDEVGELTPEIQAKLLRVLQAGEFQRVGGDRTIRVDVRLIAATNRILSKEVASGRFREDLYYRLNVFPITVPPLANRKEDIPVLAQTFVERFCRNLGRPEFGLPTSVVQTLQAYHWPGNIRELQNVIEQAVLVSEGTWLRLADPLTAATSPDLGNSLGDQTLEEVERQHILKILNGTRWKLEGAQGAAALLGLKPSTLRSRMLKLNLVRT